MSEIKVDSLTGKTSAGDITVTSEGGLATQSLQQGLIKTWMRWDMVASSLEDSLNVSSFTDVSSGISKFDYVSSMANAVYAISGIAGEKSGGGNRGLGVYGSGSLPPTTSTIRFLSYNSNFSASDESICGASISGSLA